MVEKTADMESNNIIQRGEKMVGVGAMESGADLVAQAAVETKSQGLCMTCCHASNCGLQMNSLQNVIFCEEFQDSPEAKPKAGYGFTRQQDGFSSGQPAVKVHGGLCPNCVTKTECRHADSASPIWYCEEYQ